MTSPATLEAYRRRGTWLLARCAAETGNPEPGTADFHGWLGELRGSLRPSTWRLYKLSADYVLEGHPDQLAPAAADPQVAPDKRTLPRRTSARRAKGITPSDMVALLRAITAARSRYAQTLRTWVIATILTGLRPCEWQSAILAGTTLTVVCAKFEEGWRGIDETRTLGLAALAPDDLEQVRLMANVGVAWAANGTFGAHHEACGALLRRTCAELWPKRDRRPTLYTFRHVFAANSKAGAPAEVVAALLGHAATRTAATHYGRRRDAWKRGRPPLPTTSPGAAASVRINGRSNPWAPQRPGM